MLQHNALVPLQYNILLYFMIMHPHQVRWRDGVPETVYTIEELDVLLDQLHSQNVENHPIWVSINGSFGDLSIVLGYDQSVLSFIYPDGNPPYLVSNNNSNDHSEIDCFFAGHHSPISSNNLIPMNTARQAIRTFTEHHALTVDIRWSEV
jgi:hypothetical protein